MDIDLAMVDNAQPTIHQPENGATPQRGSCSICRDQAPQSAVV